MAPVAIGRRAAADTAPPPGEAVRARDPWAATSDAAHEPPGPADPVLAELARRFAPELRFNGFVDGGSPSLQNRSEDFFPASVDAFFAWLDAGEAPVVVARSLGPGRALVRDVPFGGGAYIAADHLGGFPEAMAGQPPEQAPLYVHVYEDVEVARPRAAGGRTTAWFCEYWVFYPYDWTCSRALGGRGCMGAHRGDWEHTIYRIDGVIDGDGALAAARLTEGYYYAHGWGVRVPRAALELVDGAGAPGGEHPVVYVSQGKHGSFPAAGELHDFAGGALISDHDDFFHGNGVRVRGWACPLVDISPAARAAAPERFRPAGLEHLLARAEPPLELAAGWLDFRGRFGPDLEGALGVTWTSSATGPYQKRSFGNRGRDAEPWAGWQARFAGKLRLDRAEGKAHPPLAPPPAPERR